MKRFRFSMQRVLEYKGHMEKSEKAVLQEMRSRKLSLLDELEALRRRHDRCRAECEQKSAQGATIWEIAVIRDYMEDLRRQAQAVIDQIEQCEREIEQQVGKILSLTREKKSMEKLRERKLLEYRKEERKAEEVFIDDFVANAGAGKEREIG